MIGYGFERVRREIGHQLPNPCPIGEFYKAASAVEQQAKASGKDVSYDDTLMVRADDESIEIYFEVVEMP
jgi:hypothetical protein